MIEKPPLKLYYIEDIIEDLRLSDDEDELREILVDTALLLGEPMGMINKDNENLVPKYFTMRTIFKALNCNLLC